MRSVMPLRLELPAMWPVFQGLVPGIRLTRERAFTEIGIMSGELFLSGEGTVTGERISIRPGTMPGKRVLAREGSVFAERLLVGGGIVAGEGMLAGPWRWYGRRRLLP